ncbi:substrate-binding domain-containing protein [uncultured Megasphaera sp.]|uniref:substrate-binding domain-containing protein n=1 Tax=uncultured Megasphaera sp. TaxID=165188 RepID=UPI00265B249A|nr:substrate-binding domain-containing protein [uncultured Megasphaera sp.]
MSEEKKLMNRRTFLKATVAAALGSILLPKLGLAGSAQFQADSLQVWSCGGLAEPLMEVNALYEQKRGIRINYTGARAGTLGKALLSGASTTEIFAARGMKTVKSLRKADKMVYFKPLCFTEYVIITPKDNPAGIQKIDDMAKPGVRVILPLGASPPGGDSVVQILKKANLEGAVRKNMVSEESCVVTMMPKIIAGKGDASIVERRLTCQDQYAGKVNVIPIDPAFFPPGSIPFTAGVMKAAADRKLADDFVEFVRSDEAQAIFQKRGFIPANSERGKQLIEKLGVKDA